MRSSPDAIAGLTQTFAGVTRPCLRPVSFAGCCMAGASWLKAPTGTRDFSRLILISVCLARERATSDADPHQPERIGSLMKIPLGADAAALDLDRENRSLRVARARHSYCMILIMFTQMLEIA